MTRFAWLSVLTLAVAGGCGGVVVRSSRATRAPAPVTESCARDWSAPVPPPWETGAYQAGPLTLVAGNDLAQDPDPSELLIPFGNSLRGCPGMSHPVRLVLEPSAITVGVACSFPNSIACDRIGIGVWVWWRATLVVARIAGRLVTLSPPEDPRWHGRGLWLGYLLGVGPRHGPLAPRVGPGVTRWYGEPPVWVRLRLVAFLPNGAARALTTTVCLHPGFG